ncbi:3D-(3,5/4)-trihydroxycyclohexane-1,2-dione acylhydrolase (decyclizing) [Paracoccus sp. R12_1]|uniref:3D-(3,5/4)-trihydroxycyclohexane-1,2-dione acylhydrolase (decyclizing) n=1 Tax=unclassified Paracoccus (in: a-proteobacteria) TaxID=2688777 RepID=UPI001ADD325E|nr:MULTISPECIES: 3D-(3,5/4)-trihydroxycyclohexane-1,2-dione acylhydrolase (decyclizing) [unclassified Paracoccus (in: a-proteobacteria)]MBO9457130.1 3D-(3,5/4)-trihydroxycyclohexane-1,2-dione acylhydrolase (decyclizing) [Paracoccus sp. R12_2]MBO9488382.1 3D-(3,5/4)-trihydroxycyclohexane-1,2-dione acylhydrolase (decyclizing) [Paracoccus sp. R12_1]
MTRKTVRLTMAQALVRYLCNQFTEIDGQRVPLFAGVFGIFGHGNVTCLSEALEQVQDQLPTWRGQNEQSMALAAVAYAKAKRRRQMMIAATSIGPGATNMVTAAGVAHANRLPVLLLSGDIFTNRLPDPVLQQVEHFNNPSISVNDSFRAVSRYWDRITHPAQIISSLPQAIATMLDPADCGPAFIGLPQDIQEIAYDYPLEFFEERDWSIPRPRPDREQIKAAVEMLTAAKKPLIISGGGVRYSGAGEALARFAEARGIPMAETIAGKGAVLHDHPAYVGAMGIEGTEAARELSEAADVVVAVGTRLQDFTTGSWSTFAQDAKFIGINAARFDAYKHLALPVVGDALEALTEIDEALGDWRCDPAHTDHAKSLYADWNDLVDQGQAPTNAAVPSYAQVIGVVNKAARPNDTMIAAAGGLPGETIKNWRVKGAHSFDCEFGFSCMGYEIAGGWGHAMALDGEGTPIVMVGDGSYMLMNSDIYSSVLSGHKMIVVVCDNGGFGVINRLQTNNGIPGFNNLLKDSRVLNKHDPLHVDFVKHAESMGAYAKRCDSLADLEAAMEWAQGTDRTTVLCIASDAYAWTPGGADWYVGVPEVSERDDVRKARDAQVAFRQKQRLGV